MTDLSSRSGLPNALRVLLSDYPRAGWQGHPHFDGLVRFWLDRHVTFRRLLAAMTADAQDTLDDRIPAEAFAGRLSRLGAHFIRDLHGHHRIEDEHYFPLLARMDRRLHRGFKLLDADHHVLSGHLERFSDGANAVLRAWQGPRLREATATFLSFLAEGERLLVRHLEDEEDLIVPVILHCGPDRLG